MVFCKVLLAIPLVYTSLLSSSMFRLVQSVFIDQSSSYSSLNGCGWLLDDSTSCGVLPYGGCQDSTSRFWVIMSLMTSVVSILAPSPRGLTRVLMRRVCTRCQESMLGVMF